MAEVQNAVLRSTSVSCLRWMRAAPSPRSEKTITRLANTSASAASPYSAGLSSRATKMATTARVSCAPTCEAPTHSQAPQDAPAHVRNARKQGGRHHRRL